MRTRPRRGARSATTPARASRLADVESGSRLPSTALSVVARRPRIASPHERARSTSEREQRRDATTRRDHGSAREDPHGVLEERAQLGEERRADRAVDDAVIARERHREPLAGHDRRRP